MLAGYDVGLFIGDADVILVVHAQVPWIQRNHHLADDAQVIHVGPDPLFSAMPSRSFRNDLAIVSDAAAAVAGIAGCVGRCRERCRGALRCHQIGQSRTPGRGGKVGRFPGNGSPMTPAFVSKCVSDILGDDGVVFSELGLAVPFMDLKGPNRFFNPPFSGGLGWGMPAALGASLAHRDRLAVACIGDGSYMFANPVACHQVAEGHDLPILTIVMNNGIWNAVRRAARNVYPDGKAGTYERAADHVTRSDA